MVISFLTRIAPDLVQPNAAPQLLPEAGARHERTLEAVSCRRSVRQGSRVMGTCSRCALHAYWITSSASRSRDGGIVIPSALAVLRLMTSSNFVGCSTGRSPGLAPLRILSTYVAARRPTAEKLGPYDMSPPASTQLLTL